MGLGCVTIYSDHVSCSLQGNLIVANFHHVGEIEYFSHSILLHVHVSFV